MYYKTTASVEEAANVKDLRYKKIKTQNDSVYHMRRLEIRESQVYGSNTKKGDIKKLGFTIEEIESIRLQNKELSNVGTVLLIGGAVSIGILMWGHYELSNLNLGTFSYP